MSDGLRPALFLDRDGVINHEVGYLHRSEDVLWVEGIHSLCRLARAQGYAIVVVTNQSGIARGYYTQAQFDTLMEWMRQELAREGAAFDAVYCCPSHPEHGIGEYRIDSPDRKPGPGMLLRAADDLGLDLRRSLLVGDRCSDIGAAHAAGVPHAFLIAGTELAPCAEGSYVPVNSLREVEAWLRERGT